MAELPSRKLHLGCGRKFIPGFIHVDIAAHEHVDHVAPVDQLDWLADESVSLIYASHVLEHFGRAEVGRVLAEWHRVLEPGGWLRIAVPDFAACAKIYYEQGLADGLTGLVGLICGGQRDEYDYHKMIFDEPLLSRFLLEVGFRETRRWDWRGTEHAHLDDFSQAYLPHMDKVNGSLMSLNIEARK
jgi:predicted SAM-dependent methyltransferase